MKPEESRKLKVGQRLSWRESKTDLGTIVSTEWSAVQIEWDNGKTHSYHHNDMGDVSLAR